jgi:hypothetical protein
MPGNGPVRFGGGPVIKEKDQPKLAPRRPADPTQTLKKWLAAQAPQPATLAQLQAQLDAFTSYYNTHRPHKSLPGRATPAAYTARPKATPATGPPTPTTGSAPTKSAPPAKSPCATAAASTTSASAAPTPEPRSCC